jgi:hypothetical protein
MQFALEVLISAYIITLWLSALSQRRCLATSPAHPDRAEAGRWPMSRAESRLAQYKL